MTRIEKRARTVRRFVAIGTCSFAGFVLSCASETGRASTGASGAGTGGTNDDGVAGGTAGTPAGGAGGGSAASDAAGGGGASGASGVSGGGGASAGGGTGAQAGASGAGASDGGVSGGGAAGFAGGGGAIGGDVDCAANPCATDQVCIPDSCESGVTTGTCSARDASRCPNGRVCGCDGVIHENRCAAYDAGKRPASLSGCEAPDDALPCNDRYCDRETEACQVVQESLCDGACLPLCPGMRTITTSSCVPLPPTCSPTGRCPCTQTDEGTTIRCQSGCIG